MTHHTDRELSQLELAQLDDADFARHLLAAAAHDAPPPQASARAFRQLAQDARALSALAALGPPSEITPPLPQEVALPREVAPATRWALARRSPLEWLLLGAVAGGGVVALWLAPRVAPPPVPPAPPRPLAAQLEEQHAADRLAPEALALMVPERAASEPSPRREARAPARGASPVVPPRTSAERASRLAREVAALDAARTALAMGAEASALQQIERYRREFPDGELSADAEAVAIEALAAEGDHAALAAAARRFLARHPHDPHAPRVRELAFIKPPAPGR